MENSKQTLSTGERLEEKIQNLNVSLSILHKFISSSNSKEQELRLSYESVLIKYIEAMNELMAEEQNNEREELQTQFKKHIYLDAESLLASVHKALLAKIEGVKDKDVNIDTLESDYQEKLRKYKLKKIKTEFTQLAKSTTKNQKGIDTTVEGLQSLQDQLSKLNLLKKSPVSEQAKLKPEESLVIEAKTLNQMIYTVKELKKFRSYKTFKSMASNDDREYIKYLIEGIISEDCKKEDITAAQDFMLEKKLKWKQYKFEGIVPKKEERNNIDRMSKFYTQIEELRTSMKIRESTLLRIVKAPFRKLPLIGRKSKIQKISRLLKTIENDIEYIKNSQKKEEFKEKKRKLIEMENLLNTLPKEEKQKLEEKIQSMKQELNPLEAAVCRETLKRLFLDVADKQDKIRIYSKLKYVLHDNNLQKISEEKLKEIRALILEVQIKHFSLEDFKKAIESKTIPYLKRLNESIGKLTLKNEKVITKRESILKALEKYLNNSHNKQPQQLHVEASEISRRPTSGRRQGLR